MNGYASRFRVRITDSMAENKKVKVLLDKETHDHIRQLSKRLGVSVPKLLNEASRLLMKRYEKVLYPVKTAQGKDPKNEEQNKDPLQAAG